MTDKLYKIILALLLLTITIPAQTVISKYGGEFLTLGAGGRTLGLGGAGVAFVNDVSAGYWNPAGLANIDYPQAALMHEEHFGSLANYDYGGIAIPYGEDMSLGLTVLRLSIDGIPDTRDAMIDIDGDGVLDFNPAQIPYDKIKEFNNTDWAVYFSFAKRLSENFSWGASIKLISRSLADNSATGIGFDIGAIYKPYKNLILGANFQDVTTTLVAWDTGRNELISPTLKIGAAYQFEFLYGVFMPVLDFDIRFEGREFASNFNIGPVSFDLHSGLEYCYKNLISVRGGYNDVKQISFGGGIKLPKLTIDYSFAKFTNSSEDTFKDTHRISLMFTLENEKYKR